MLQFAWPIVIASAAFMASAAFSGPSDTVVICRLISEKVVSDPADPHQKPRQINEEFVLKFNDAEQIVTYIAGPAIRISPTDKFDFENRIYFLGDSVIEMDGLIMRYSGEINRLTGNIRLGQLYLNASDRQRSYRRPWFEKVGTCTAGPRKF